MIPADKRIERLTQVARMYYEQNMNQSEIAPGRWAYRARW